MCVLLALLVSWFLGALPLCAQEYAKLEEAPHHYWDKTPQDPFTKLYSGFSAPKIEAESELEALKLFLKWLDIPESSQMLVYSATSLQSGKIHPESPRALYFNEHTYVGYVPNGRLEIISIDPELGAIFYLLDMPKKQKLPVLDRSTRCMNCHQGDRMNFAPGLSIESVIPSMTGASLDGFRRGIFGHAVPMKERFGGYYLTGDQGLTQHHGNLVGALSPKGLKLTYHKPGELFDWNHYPVQTSDLLAHLLHEHQAGFVNLVVEGIYRNRYLLHLNKGKFSEPQKQELQDHAQKIVDYLFFLGEAPLPAQGLPKLDPQYQADFLKDRRPAKNGKSLRDLHLKGHLFQHRCSYMVHSELFLKMPTPLKNLVYQKMKRVLAGEDPRFAYLPASERAQIQAILTDTLPDWNG